MPNSLQKGRQKIGDSHVEMGRARKNWLATAMMPGLPAASASVSRLFGVLCVLPPLHDK